MSPVWSIMPHMSIGICRNMGGPPRRDVEIYGKDILTWNPFPSVVVPSARTQASRPEGGATPPARGSESQPREDPRRTLQHYLVLRFPGPRASPVRDAPSTPCRQPPGERSGRPVRGQPAHFLSDGQNIRAGGNPWSGPSKTGSEGSASLHAGDRAVRPEATGRVARSDNGRDPSGGVLTIRADYSPPDARARPRQSQKGGATGQQSESSWDFPGKADMTSQYETLRESALSLDSTPRPAVGLGVFIIRGMIGWLEALPSLVSQHGDNDWPAAQSGWSRSVGQSELVSILADMVISSTGGLQ